MLGKVLHPNFHIISNGIYFMFVIVIFVDLFRHTKMELSQDETTNLMGCFSEIDETNLIYLKLLCKDVLGRGRLSKITLASLPTLFTNLQRKGVISTGNFSWLRKCFDAINRKDLAQRLPRDDVRLGLKDTTTISPFRMLTVEIAMDITETELQLMKFALQIRGGITILCFYSYFFFGS